jgi:FG-GAP repeat
MNMKIIKTLLLLFGIFALLSSEHAAAQITPEIKPNIPSNVDWSFESNQAGETSPDHRALSVGNKCDVNNDGYDDLIIGKRDFNISAYTDNGIAWLFLGSASGLPTSPSLTLNPPYSNSYGFFGWQAKCAGDVNGDGFDDLIISMDNYDNIYDDEGAVYVYYGSASPDASYDWMARGNSTYAHFGVSVDGAGDINGDGYDDIIVGANGNDYPGVITEAYVWYGGLGGLGANGLPSNADWHATDNTLTISFAYQVRGIGDVNGDGYDDILVGAHNYDGTFNNQGAVFVYYGDSSGLGPTGTTANADWMATGEQSDAYLGFASDGVGDLNGDGFDDLAVGAYAYDHSESNEGMVFVWYGSATGLGANGTPVNADWEAESNTSSAIFGYSVAPAGDVNNDGYNDLLVSAPGYPIGGAWFVWIGSDDGLGPNGSPLNCYYSGYSDQTGANLGRDNAGALDANGDGRDDIFVPARLYSNGQSYEGMVFGYYSMEHYQYLSLIMR